MDEKVVQQQKRTHRKAKAFYFTQFGVVAPVMVLEACKFGKVDWPIVVFGVINLIWFISAVAAEKICLAAINTKGVIPNDK
jgi:hypothetical protein